MIVPLAYEVIYVDAYVERLKKTQPAIKQMSKASASLRMAKDNVDSGRTKGKKALLNAGTAAVKAQISARPEVAGILGLDLPRFLQDRAGRMLSTLKEHAMVRAQVRYLLSCCVFFFSHSPSENMCAVVNTQFLLCCHGECKM